MENNIIDKKRFMLKAHILAAITITIWGTTYISIKLLLVDFSPSEIMFYRFIIAFIFLYIIKPKGLPFNSIKEELFFALAGFCGVTLYFILQNTCLVYTLASNAGVLVSIAPFFTAILSLFLLKTEMPKKSFFIGFFFSIIGIALISFNGNFILKLNPLGDMMAIASAFVWALYSILMKILSEKNYDIILCTRKIFFYGLITMLPILPLLDFKFGFERFASVPNLLNMLYLGLFASALCFVTWNYALKVLGAVKTSVYIYFNPIVTIISSALFLRERITVVAMAGVFLILFGLYISENKLFIKNNKA